MKKRVLIDQPGWLGDIIFVMAIAQKYADEGHVVDFPVFDEYYNASIQKYFPTINMIPFTQFVDYYKYHNRERVIEYDEYIYLPVGTSPFRVSKQHMRNKYDVVGLSVDMWRNIKINRDYEEENNLFMGLGLNAGDKYNLINENHQNGFIRVPINIPFWNGYENIYMNKIDGYTMFDWIGVMEKAQSIHTVGTSLVYLMDSIDTMPIDMHIYPRIDKPHSTYDYLLKKKYIYH